MQLGDLLPYALALLALLALFVGVLFLLRTGARIAASSVVVRELEAPPEETAAEALGAGELQAQATAALAGGEGPEEDQLQALAAEVASTDPEAAARVVRGWLAEDAS